MYVETKSLSDPVQAALRAVGYGKRDIEVVPGSTVVLATPAYGNGWQGFTAAVDATTGRALVMRGSWGGANPFEHNPVDTSDEIYTLPENGIVIKGQRGGGKPTIARIHCHPSFVARMLPAPAEETTDEEQQALFCFIGIKGGSYRVEELRRRRVRPSTVESLIERGYLTRNKAGAVQVTTKGRNARDTQRVRY